MNGNLNVSSIWSVLVSSSDGAKIVSALNNGDTPKGMLFSPSGRVPSMIGLWIMAVGTVILGSMWATPTHKVRVAAAPSHAERDLEVEVVEVTTKAAFSFIFFASAALVLLFYLMSYLIIVIIVIFCIGSSTAMFHCLHYLSIRIFKFRVDSFWMRKTEIPCCGEVLYLHIGLALICMSISIWFFFARHEEYAWFLQDIMGISMCLLFLKSFRFPNIRISSILLCLAFVYDIFWVFISPYLFQGESVMVKVATGGGTNEMVPMLLKFPNFCERCSAGLLGLGDIVLPGLLVSFTYAFDTAKSLRLVSGYFLYNVIGYGIGLIITYMALLYMEKGQPALLYLVPLTLGTTLVLAIKRGHLKEIWNGIEMNENETLMPETSKSSV
eukprot:c19105_g1_i1.p1 GENE.c19105_g1_i1~~c19105_g1_i1.p1  ORF type:complete len:383 (+),score=125.47 c19105_g1_i1:381-1529(+)